MTKTNSIVPQERLQAINSLAMVLLTMTEHYALPESVNCVIQDMQTEVENLLGAAIISKHVHNLKITSDLN
jgi:hypothetical protein